MFLSNYNFLHLVFFFFLNDRTCGIWKFRARDQIWATAVTYVRSSTHHTKLGIEPSLPQTQWWILNLPYHSGNSFSHRFFLFVFAFQGVAYGSSQVRGWIRAVLPAYTTATAMRDLSHICNLHRSSWSCQIPNPLRETRDRTRVLMDPSRVRDCWAATCSRLFLKCVFGRKMHRDSLMRFHNLSTRVASTEMWRQSVSRPQGLPCRLPSSHFLPKKPILALGA